MHKNLCFGFPTNISLKNIIWRLGSHDKLETTTEQKVKKRERPKITGKRMSGKVTKLNIFKIVKGSHTLWTSR